METHCKVLPLFKINKKVSLQKFFWAKNKQTSITERVLKHQIHFSALSQFTTVIILTRCLCVSVMFINTEEGPVVAKLNVVS